ncbi:hypothetical protein NDU88_003633 [Pleurodeles waltl]|uniref:Uncharacterized protein n=1 Tax=Pleurodeles waltl TaxID=8319 RepID=A0AAV7TP89_PLEWA|nr:hypothetical protein NDU88_003633 [Pleurodeles waltl]
MPGGDTWSTEARGTGQCIHMEDPESDLSLQRDAILSELLDIHNTATSLVKELQTLVHLTDPEKGTLNLAQEKALNSLDIWKSLFCAVADTTDK